MDIVSIGTMVDWVLLRVAVLMVWQIWILYVLVHNTSMMIVIYLSKRSDCGFMSPLGPVHWWFRYGFIQGIVAMFSSQAWVLMRSWRHWWRWLLWHWWWDIWLISEISSYSWWACTSQRIWSGNIRGLWQYNTILYNRWNCRYWSGYGWNRGAPMVSSDYCL